MRYGPYIESTLKYACRLTYRCVNGHRFSEPEEIECSRQTNEDPPDYVQWCPECGSQEFDRDKSPIHLTATKRRFIHRKPKLEIAA